MRKSNLLAAVAVTLMIGGPLSPRRKRRSAEREEDLQGRPGIEKPNPEEDLPYPGGMGWRTSQENLDDAAANSAGWALIERVLSAAKPQPISRPSIPLPPGNDEAGLGGNHRAASCRVGPSR